MEEKKILSMTIIVPDDKVGKDIRLMTKDDRTREFRVSKMRIDGGREVKPKKFLKFKTPGEHKLEFEISTNVITSSLFYCEYEEQMHVTQLHIPNTVVEMKERCFEHFIFDCEVVIPDSVKIFNGIDGCQKGIKMNGENLTVLNLSVIPETEVSKEDVIIKEGVTSISGWLNFHTKHIHIPASVKTMDAYDWSNLYKCSDRLTFAEDHPTYHIQNDCVVQNSDNVVMQIGRNTAAWPDVVRRICNKEFICYEDIVPPVLDVERLVLPKDLLMLDTDTLPFRAMKKLKEIVLPDGLTTLGSSDGLFTSIQAEELTIPASVTKIASRMLGPKAMVRKVTFLGDISQFNLDDIFRDSPQGLTAYKDGKIVWTNIVPEVQENEDESGFVLSDDGKTLMKYEGTAESVVIPKKIKKIADGAFKGCTTIKSVTLPDSVKEVRKNVFQDCKNLTEVTLGKSVKRIWEYAFEGCPIKQISLSDTVTQIDRRAFCGSQFEEIKLPVSLKKCTFAFQESKLKRGVVPEGVEAIDYSHCNELESISIPENITKIPDYLISHCQKITEINIPATVTEIGTCAYRGTSIKQVTLPAGLKFIDSSAFGETNLEEVIMPDSVEIVRSNAFCGCTSLKRVVFGNNISSIGDKAFGNCEALEEVVIPDGRNVNISPAAFSLCKNLKRIITPDGKDSQFKEKILKTTQMVVVFS